MSSSELISGQPGDGLALLPGNASAFERANSQVAARLFDLDVAAIESSRDPARCDAAFTPFLAWERSIHFWSPGDDSGNRARIETAFNDHLSYGAPAALETEIALDTGQSVKLIEFFEDSTLTWPGFVVASKINPGDPAPDLDALMASALTRKNVRDMPQARVLSSQPVASQFVGAGTGVTVSAKILPGVPPQPQIYFGAGTGVLVSAKILPVSH